jgi:hypothetical protein
MMVPQTYPLFAGYFSSEEVEGTMTDWECEGMAFQQRVYRIVAWNVEPEYVPVPMCQEVGDAEGEPLIAETPQDVRNMLRQRIMAVRDRRK